MGLLADLPIVSPDQDTDEKARRRRWLLNLADAAPELYRLLKLATSDAEGWADEARDLIDVLEGKPRYANGSGSQAQAGAPDRNERAGADQAYEHHPG